MKKERISAGVFQESSKKHALSGATKARSKRNASILSDHSGFTFLNMLFSFSIFAVISASSALLIPHLYRVSEDKRDINPLEWEIFQQQAAIEFREGTAFKVQDQMLSFTSKTGRSIEFEKYGTMIRRQVNNTGHIICLRHVKDMQFTQIEGGALLTVVSTSGKTYRCTFRGFLGLKRSG